MQNKGCVIIQVLVYLSRNHLRKRSSGNVTEFLPFIKTRKVSLVCNFNLWIYTFTVNKIHYQINISYLNLKLRFGPYKAEKPPGGMELQEKKEDKEKTHRGSLI